MNAGLSLRNDSIIDLHLRRLALDEHALDRFVMARNKNALRDRRFLRVTVIGTSAAA